MNKKIIASLYKKEMLDVIRDKKTIIIMIFVPLVLYPLLFVGGLFFMNGIMSGISENTYVVAFQKEPSRELARLFKEDKDREYSFKIVEAEDCNKALLEEKIDAYIECDTSGAKTEYRIHYISSAANSSYAAEYCSETLKKYAKDMTVSLIEAMGLDSEELLNPVEISYADMASNEESAGNIFGTILPYMLIISLLMGTVYPAIDATAGEREKGEPWRPLLPCPLPTDSLFLASSLQLGLSE